MAKIVQIIMDPEGAGDAVMLDSDGRIWSGNFWKLKTQEWEDIGNYPPGCGPRESPEMVDEWLNEYLADEAEERAYQEDCGHYNTYGWSPTHGRSA